MAPVDTSKSGYWTVASFVDETAVLYQDFGTLAVYVGIAEHLVAVAGHKYWIGIGQRHFSHQFVPSGKLPGVD